MSKVIDVAYLEKQIKFSERTFGPGLRTRGLSDHVRKELVEIEDKPQDTEEWVDVVMLGLDGAWRSGASPQAILNLIHAKLEKNISRTWPDWRFASDDTAIEHDRTVD